MEEKTLKLVGHAARWDALRRAFAADRVPQSLLISGPAHTGKWTLARAWAQLLLCPNARDNIVDGLPSPCLKCRTCHQVEVETFPDLRVVRPIINKSNPQRAPEALDSSSILVEAARDFVAEAGYRPTVGERKVMMIYQADRMAPEAQNTLLKTLEEPGAGVKIILITDRPLELLPTIRSRCWQLELGLASPRDIQLWLSEHFPQLAPALLKRAVEAGGGRPGLAWRQAVLLGEDALRPSRSEQVLELTRRIEKAAPWGFLALSESAQKLAEAWGEEDAIARTGDEGGSDDKKLARTLVRSQLARFLDGLAGGYRTRWIGSLASSRGQEKRVEAAVWAAGLDRIGKTRHYILRNANAPLALDVLFSELVQAHQAQDAAGARAIGSREAARVPQQHAAAASRASSGRS